jgi:flagellar motor switch protein FliN/FliY
VPEFAPMQATQNHQLVGTMDRFFDVHVPIWAELGRVEMPLGDLMKLDEGAVLRLDRPVGEPVDLMSQGVKLARGEVVVIDDCFAVRIKEIEKSPKSFK